MSKKLFIIASLLCIMVVIGHAQSYQRIDGGIKTIINSTDIDIRFYSPSTVRIVKSPEGKFFTKNSLSVILAPQKTDLNVSQAGDELSLKSKNLLVNLNLENGRISFAKITLIAASGIISRCTKLVAHKMLSSAVILSPAQRQLNTSSQRHQLRVATISNATRTVPR